MQRQEAHKVKSGLGYHGELIASPSCLKKSKAGIQLSGRVFAPHVIGCGLHLEDCQTNKLTKHNNHNKNRCERVSLRIIRMSGLVEAIGVSCRVGRSDVRC